jgi:hypothetical protein
MAMGDASEDDRRQDEGAPLLERKKVKIEDLHPTF